MKQTSVLVLHTTQKACLEIRVTYLSQGLNNAMPSTSISKQKPCDF